MPAPVHHSAGLIYSPGTQVVVIAQATADPTASDTGRSRARGSVGVVLRSDPDGYRVRFLDGAETTLPRGDVTMLERYKQGGLFAEVTQSSENSLCDRVFLKCIIGSRAYGLEGGGG